jgi:hypothetical protein
LASSWSARDLTRELVTQDERPGDARVADAGLVVPVEVRPAQPDGVHLEQYFVRRGPAGRLSAHPDVARAMKAGDVDKVTTRALVHLAPIVVSHGSRLLSVMLLG